jgi:hypothetical protein
LNIWLLVVGAVQLALMAAVAVLVVIVQAFLMKCLVAVR